MFSTGDKLKFLTIKIYDISIIKWWHLSYNLYPDNRNQIKNYVTNTNCKEMRIIIKQQRELKRKTNFIFIVFTFVEGVGNDFII